MLVAVDVNATREYTLEKDRGENPTVFEIGVLDGILGPYLLDKHTTSTRMRGGEQGIEMKAGSYMLDIVRHGLRGWRNFHDAAGKEIEFKRVQVSVAGVGVRWVADERCLAMLESEWLTELANEIKGDNTVTELDEKNSKPLSEK